MEDSPEDVTTIPTQKTERMKAINVELFNQLYFYVQHSIPKQHSFAEIQAMLNSLSQAPVVDVTFKND